MKAEQLTERLNKAMQYLKNAHEVFLFMSERTNALIAGKELTYYISIEKETLDTLIVYIEFMPEEANPSGCEILINKSDLQNFIFTRLKDEIKETVAKSETEEIMNNDLSTKESYIKDFINEHY